MWETIRHLAQHQHALARTEDAHRLMAMTRVYDRNMSLGAAVHATVQHAGTWDDDVAEALAALAVESLVALEIAAPNAGAHALLQRYLDRAESRLPITEPRTLQEKSCPS